MASLWVTQSSDGLTVTAYRGEGSCLLAMDIDDSLRTREFVGFSIEVRYPGSPQFGFLKNLLDFEYGPGHEPPFSSKDAPFQTFRWVHVPTEIGTGQFTYRISVATMDAQGHVSQTIAQEVSIDLSPRTVPDFVNIAFTRAFASSQAYDRRFKAQGGRNILPPPAGAGCNELTWAVQQYEPMYAWLGFESRNTLLGCLNAYAGDTHVTLDVLAYDFSEPSVVKLLTGYANRLRIIIDDSADHAGTATCESVAAGQLQQSTGADRVKRMHFSGLQHNKVLIAKRDGKPFRVLTGSTNFSLRGMCIQATNLLDFNSEDVAKLYADLFDAYWTNAKTFRGSAMESAWHDVQDPSGTEYSFCFSPHSDAELSLQPVAQAIADAQASVLFAVAFLYNSTGLVRNAIDAAVRTPAMFTYGISDKKGNLTLSKPNGRRAIVNFAALGASAPPPFQQEWTGDRVSRCITSSSSAISTAPTRYCSRVRRTCRRQGNRTMATTSFGLPTRGSWCPMRSRRSSCLTTSPSGCPSLTTAVFRRFCSGRRRAATSPGSTPTLSTARQISPIVPCLRGAIHAKRAR